MGFLPWSKGLQMQIFCKNRKKLCKLLVFCIIFAEKLNLLFMGTYNQELSEFKRKRGRPPRFKTAKDLEKAFEEYKAFTDAHPFEVVTIFKGEESIRRIPHPYTLCGFMVFCELGEWRDFARYTRERGEDFSAVISRIEVEVREQQVAGGMGGVYNSNLTARLNGLTDKKDLTSKGEQIDLKFEIVDGKGE